LQQSERTEYLSGSRILKSHRVKRCTADLEDAAGLEVVEDGIDVLEDVMAV
jgi:hypothetical protein